VNRTSSRGSPSSSRTTCSESRASRDSAASSGVGIACSLRGQPMDNGRMNKRAMVSRLRKTPEPKVQSRECMRSARTGCARSPCTKPRSSDPRRTSTEASGIRSQRMFYDRRHRSCGHRTPPPGRLTVAIRGNAPNLRCYLAFYGPFLVNIWRCFSVSRVISVSRHRASVGYEHGRSSSRDFNRSDQS
jgi:hypothetical protein